jgi:hypothetical protein
MARKERTTRVAFGVPRLKMNLDAKTEARLKKEGVVPRWINDEDHGQRLKNAIDGGYEFVNADGTEEVGTTKEVQDRDRRIRKLVGANKDGSAKYAYLMAIPREYYDEDQAKKEATNRMVDDAIRGGSPGGLKPHGIAPDKGGTYVKNVDYTP